MNTMIMIMGLLKLFLSRVVGTSQKVWRGGGGAWRKGAQHCPLFRVLSLNADDHAKYFDVSGSILS
jgi:hypothetical protein